MPGIKDDGVDSDNEEMEQESPLTEKSSNESSESSEDEGDSDSSEMDEVECERRRMECVEDMYDLERQFALLRDQLYRERTQQAECKLDEVKLGHALEYLQPLADLQKNMQITTEIAGILKEFKLHNLENKKEAEDTAARQNYESEKMLLKDLIRGQIEERLRKLEEDRHNIDISSDIYNEQNFKKKNKRSEYLGSEKRRKPVTVSGPYIVYMLREEDVLDDWTTIKKALKVGTTSKKIKSI